MTVTHEELLKSFVEKHSTQGRTFMVSTSPLREDGSYIKTYTFSDGAQFVEVNRPVYEDVYAVTMIKGVRVSLHDTVKLLETECWSTDQSKSIKFYERW